MDVRIETNGRHFFLPVVNGEVLVRDESQEHLISEIQEQLDGGAFEGYCDVEIDGTNAQIDWILDHFDDDVVVDYCQIVTGPECDPCDTGSDYDEIF